MSDMQEHCELCGKPHYLCKCGRVYGKETPAALPSVEESPAVPVSVLADRCFDAGQAEDELYKAIHLIMGGKPASEQDGWESPVHDTYVDPYDSSVEVILDKESPRMTRQQADAIISLGFGQVYESHGEVGRQWTKTYDGACSPRHASSDDSQLRVQALRAKFSTVKAELAAAKAKLTKFGLLEEQLENYKDQWKRHYEKAVADFEYEKQAWFNEHLNEEANDLREALAKAHAEAAAMREVLQDACEELEFRMSANSEPVESSSPKADAGGHPFYGGYSAGHGILKRAKNALSSDCGADYVPRAKLAELRGLADGMRDVLDDILAVVDPEGRHAKRISEATEAYTAYTKEAQ